MHAKMRIIFVTVAIAGALASGAASRDRSVPFGIQVVDDATGRGVPLVELETTANAIYVTDSAGWVAFDEPGLMNQRVFFKIRSHGYAWPECHLGTTGAIVRISAQGGTATLKIRRVNIAERLYRLTGAGIYRDSVLLDKPAPIRKPVLNGKVVGQDSAQQIIYKQRAYWFWGDTQRPGYPLGLFQTSGAWVDLEKTNPETGVEYNYFTGSDGFSRPMCPLKDSQDILVWIDGLAVVPDDAGVDRLTCRYAMMRDLGKKIGDGLAIYDDGKEIFTPVRKYPEDARWRKPQGHPIRIDDAQGGAQLIFPAPWPVVRTRAKLAALTNSASFEAFTCLAPGTRYATNGTARIERDASGGAIWGWKPDTDPIQQLDEKQLVAAGQLRPDETRFQLRSAQDGSEVRFHGGTFYWNAYRQRWVMIGLQLFGKTSMLGEVWYAEAKDLTGPWRTAVKIVTHDDYSFYNPAHIPFFDREGGRYIYFEGTYTSSFSGAKRSTPWYEYNQILYRLDLADPRLAAAQKGSDTP